MWLMENGYASMLRNQGSNMLEFMSAMNDLHKGLKKGLPHLVPPRMICTKDADEALSLEYVSYRSGLAPMMSGLVTQVGRSLFHSDYMCTMETQWKSQDENGKPLEHTRFRISRISGLALDQAPDPDEVDEGLSAICMEYQQLKRRGHDFLQRNACMASAWSYILVERVKCLQDMAYVHRFGRIFCFEQFKSVLGSYTPEARGLGFRV